MFTFLTANGGVGGDFAAVSGTDLGDGLALWPFTDGFGYYLYTYAP